MQALAFSSESSWQPFSVAHKSNRSTVNAFASPIHHIYKSLNTSMKSVRCALLDYSFAFHSFPRPVLIHKLQTFVCPTPFVTWPSDHFNNRTQCIQLGGKTSKQLRNNSSVHRVCCLITSATYQLAPAVICWWCCILSGQRWLSEFFQRPICYLRIPYTSWFISQRTKISQMPVLFGSQPTPLSRHSWTGMHLCEIFRDYRWLKSEVFFSHFRMCNQSSKVVIPNRKASTLHGEKASSPSLYTHAFFQSFFTVRLLVCRVPWKCFKIHRRLLSVVRGLSITSKRQTVY